MSEQTSQQPQQDLTADESDSHTDSPLPEAAAPKALVDGNARPLNPRSCVTCRRRKVRCDKTHPCANCVRQHIECIFPAPGRAPRRIKKIGDVRDKELLERLRRLEGVVKNLGVDVNDVDHAAADLIHKEDAEEEEEVEGFRDRTFNESAKLNETLATSRFDHKFGRLVINHGKSRYVTSSFWASLSNEVEDLKGILNQSSGEEDYIADDSPTSEKPHQRFVFGFSSQDVDLLSYHPSPSLIPTYWRIFKENVDPVVKVIHVPTVEKTILSAASHLSVLSRSFECFMFAVYYSAATTLAPEECSVTFGESKPFLIAKYRFAVEQSLARANFLITEELVVLQAFLIFLICMRKNSGARIIWTLTGLVVRMAQTMGVHRDGTHFNLSPFETEMRRRTWWQICLLDTRASEDHGCDPTIVESTFDTKLPLNINDADISPDMKTYPQERQGCVDITFSLIRFEVANTFRRINYIPPGPSKACMNVLTNVTLEEKEKWITESHKRLEEKYLKNCDMSVPIYWVTATVARLIMSKMWLMVYHPAQRRDGGSSLSQETKDKLFITSLENMEYSLLLATEARTQRWSWLFKTYMQWHALAFILSELCHRTKGDLVDRAWVAVEKMRYGRWSDSASAGPKGGHLWRPLRKLYRKALDARTKQMHEDPINFPATMPIRTYSPNANPMFGHTNRSRVTRAPLSQAQLDRYAMGPVFGDRPMDSHRLLRSPQGSDASKESEINPMASSTSSVTKGGIASSTATQMSDLYTQPFDLNNVGSQSRTQQPFLSRDRPQFGHRFLGGQGTQIDFSDLDLPGDAQNVGDATTGAGLTQDSFPLGVVDGFETNMDAGEINWENWDQLVQQYGMDLDHPDTTAGWTGSNWNADSMQPQQNMRMGNGWFI